MLGSKSGFNVPSPTNKLFNKLLSDFSGSGLELLAFFLLTFIVYVLTDSFSAVTLTWIVFIPSLRLVLPDITTLALSSLAKALTSIFVTSLSTVIEYVVVAGSNPGYRLPFDTLNDFKVLSLDLLSTGVGSGVSSPVPDSPLFLLTTTVYDLTSPFSALTLISNWLEPLFNVLVPIPVTSAFEWLAEPLISIDSTFSSTSTV